MTTNLSKKLLSSLEGKSGVYIISNEYSPSGYFLIKVGLAVSKKELGSKKRHGGLRRRLESYLLCYPRGFYIFALFTTRYDTAYKVEKAIQSYLTGKGRKASFPHSHIEEWYWVKAAEISRIVDIHLNAPKVPIIMYQKWDPYLKIASNPTAGRQRKIKPILLDERRDREKYSSAVRPPSTFKKSKQRYIERYESDIISPKVLTFD